MDLLEFQASILARAAADIADYLAAMHLDLYQTPIVITPQTPVATFTAALATYTGYAQGVVTWLAPSVSDDGTVEVAGTIPEFRPTDGVTPNVIYGVFCRAAVGGALLFAAAFDNGPLPMENALNAILLTVRYRPSTRSVCVVVS